MKHLLSQTARYLSQKRSIISREGYLQKIQSKTKSSLITVITGMRRSGKSYLILDYIRHLSPKNKVFYFSKELDPFDDIPDAKAFQKLLELFKKENGEPTHIIIDEIQDIVSWEKSLRMLYALKKYTIIVTGSNAHLLSGELATYLAGRYTTLEVFPLTFEEYLLFSHQKKSAEALSSYLLFGGLPEIAKISGNQEKEDYLSAIVESVVLKDVVSRHRIRDVGVLERILLFFAGNIGSLTTLRKISTFFESRKVKVSLPTILSYVSFFIEAYLLHEVKRYDVRGKKLLEINHKYYFSDTGIRNALLKNFSLTDVGFLLENAVFTTLRSYGYHITVGKYDAREIDFCAEKNGKRTYIQAAYSLAEQTTWEREIASLLSLPDAYPRYIVTLDAHRRGNHRGIEVIGFEDMKKYFSGKTRT